jgi:hypothetical protein
MPEQDGFLGLAGGAEPGAERAGMGGRLVVRVVRGMRDGLGKDQAGQ